MTELRLAPHSERPGQHAVEVWIDGAFVATLTPRAGGADGEGVRVISKHPLTAALLGSPDVSIRTSGHFVNVIQLEIGGAGTMRTGVDVRDATHVKVNGQYVKIVSKWGIDSTGRLAKPSEGGFGVVTETGERIDMWHAQGYAADSTA